MANRDPIKNVRQILLGQSSYTIEEVSEAVDEVLKMKYFLNTDRDLLIRRVEETFRIRQDEYRIIENSERRRPWLNEKRTSINFENGFWGRYRDYLNDEKGFPPDTITKLDHLTDRILDNLFDPNEKIKIDKKGLVAGHVQSGKTSNYTGLICKAADSGYKLIIILAGIHNNLRSQTQIRIDESFLGFDTQFARAFDQQNSRIGVGLFGEPLAAHSLTSSEEKGDFTKGAAPSFDTNDPIIAVIKKNKSPLNKIYQWLSSKAEIGADGKKQIRNKSLLLIDDEADNASINISNNEERRSEINSHITNILGLFGKSSYIGYTATPFANIFIPMDSENLFPRDFVINIPPPSNYIGPEQIFGFTPLEEGVTSDGTLPLINRIDDYNETIPNGHKKDTQKPTTIPGSLKTALKCFILTCAIRRLRGQTKSHNSMLIHVSRFVDWQDAITELVANQFNYYRKGIDQNDDGIIEEFKNTFEHDSKNYRSFQTVSNQIINSKLKELDTQIQVHQWDDVLPHLNEAISRIKVKAIHGGSGEALEYYDHKDGLSVIAIGGNKLSRGLTLEGLSVSYYLRASKMYDTLMQMGRWFGYKSGYLDLCRLFTSREINEWFCHITQASEELREEFDHMSDVAGSSPEHYALKIRTHPGVLQISATNKMKGIETVDVSWSGRLVESYEFKKDKKIIDENFKNTQNFISTLSGKPKEVGQNFIWYDISPKQIFEFLNGLQSMENLKKAEPKKLIDFISAQLKNHELTHWRVALMSKRKTSDDSESSVIINNNKTNITQILRTEDANSSDDNVYYVKKSHIIGGSDESIDLSAIERERAVEMTKAFMERKKKKTKSSAPIGHIVRDHIRDPKNPLLLIYFINPKKSLGSPMKVDTEPFVGYAVSFPKSEFNVPVSYAVHKELLDKFNINDEDIVDEVTDEK